MSGRTFTLPPMSDTLTRNVNVGWHIFKSTALLELWLRTRGNRTHGVYVIERVRVGPYRWKVHRA